MKRLFVLTAFLMSGCTGLDFREQPDFHVDLTLIHSEESEDSNSTTEHVVIDGYHGTYTWTYEGHSPDPESVQDQHETFVLGDHDLQELNLLIRENGLLVDREETVSSGEPWSAFDVQWTMEISQKSATGHVVGEPVSWDDWTATGHDNFSDDESLYAAEAVFDFVRGDLLSDR